MATSAHASRVTRSRHLRGRSAASAPAVDPLRVMLEIAALLLIAALLIAIPVLSRSADSTASTDTTQVLIQKGDTLWSVAQSNPVPGLSTAQAVDRIAALNRIESASLPVGSSILVPAEPSGLELACK